jgi:hypothetical protein
MLEPNRIIDQLQELQMLKWSRAGLWTLTMEAWGLKKRPRAGIFKLLWSPGIYSRVSIPPADVVAGQ